MVIAKKQQIIIPQHIAIIMDGNSRWARNKKLPTKVGHNFGVKNIEKIVKACIEEGVRYLTLYAFSSENWDRPKDEVHYLINLLDEYLDKDIQKLVKNDVRVQISGEISKLPAKTQDKIQTIEIKTNDNKTINLIVAFGYGARQEIISATKSIALAVKENKTRVEDIDDNLFRQNLYIKDVPDPDLLIRTAGDFRISNFLLWQIAYSELYFSHKFWPDFKKSDLKKAIKDFNQRERRYGKR
ncbi:MAG: isoprenyl transferase [Rickettsiales bacterium]|nr:isoprenyl transferase [Rickettsiales bacterium]